MSKNFEIERESTGVVGFDEMIQGGFPRGSVIGVIGSPGVGKSIFSLHFVLEGARKGQKSVYISLEEPRANVDNMINEFKFGEEFLKFEKEGLIVVKCLDYEKYEKIQEDLFEHIKRDLNIKRLVVDSFNCFFTANVNNSGLDVSVRRAIMEIFYNLRRNGLTTILTLEKSEDSNYNIPYLVDGIVNLDSLDLGVIERRVFIPKMRWTCQCKDGRAYEIGVDGIIVSPDLWGDNSGS